MRGRVGKTAPGWLKKQNRCRDTIPAAFLFSFINSAEQSHC